MSSLQHISVLLPSSSVSQWTEDLAALGFMPDPMAQRRQVFGMVKVLDPTQSESVGVYLGERMEVWQGDHPALYEQITTRLGTNQWTTYVVYFAYHPWADQETLMLLRWVAQHYPAYAVVTHYHYLLEPADVAALDPAMFYWGNNPWDDDDK